MLPSDNLNPISQRPRLAVALHDKLYLVEDWEDDFKLLFHQPVNIISCVCWSQRGDLLAVGFEKSVQIWIPEEKKVLNFSFLEGFGIPRGFVTAFAWKGLELLAANDESGIIRYELTLTEPVPMRYKSDKSDERVTALIWKDDIIVSSAGDKIYVWDANKRNAPIRTMTHPGVRTLKFHPLQPKIIISGGEDGLIFWTFQGSMRSRTKMKVTVLVHDMAWSPFQNDELVVAHCESLSLWDLGSVRATKKAELKSGVGSIVHGGLRKRHGFVRARRRVPYLVRHLSEATLHDYIVPFSTKECWDASAALHALWPFRRSLCSVCHFGGGVTYCKE